MKSWPKNELFSVLILKLKFVDSETKDRVYFIALSVITRQRICFLSEISFM